MWECFSAPARPAPAIRASGSEGAEPAASSAFELPARPSDAGCGVRGILCPHTVACQHLSVQDAGGLEQTGEAWPSSEPGVRPLPRPPLKGRQAPLGQAPPARGPLRPPPSWGTPWPRGSCTSPDRHGGQSRQRTGWDCPAGPGLLLHSSVWGPRDRRTLGQSSAAPQWLSPGQQVGLAVTHPRPQLVRWGFVSYYTTGLLSTWPSPGETTLARWLRTAPCWRG